MELKFKKRFLKNIKKFNKKIQKRTQISLEKFKNGDRDRQLNLHSLSRGLSHLKTINVTGDIRVLLDPKTGEVVEILDIGTNSEFY